MHRKPGTSLHFPDVPKLELDQLIDQLVERAQDVKRVQGRLRALLRAIETVTGDLSLEVVLGNIVEAACELAGARYAALGVIGADGGLEQFIHVGMDGDTVERIGHLPGGRGLLGALINDPRAIRLERMTDDPRSVGFPDNHPPMSSFLGVPLHVRGEVFGNLYLAESARGQFTDEDEQLVVALASAAGAAVANARRYQESRTQQQWLSASVEIGAELLAGDGGDPLPMIARLAQQNADADTVTVSLLTDDGARAVIEVAFGRDAEALAGRRHELPGTLTGQALAQRRPLVFPSVPADNGHLITAEMGPVMMLPLRREADMRGVLTLIRERGRRPFTATDLDMAAAYANHASVALELADSRAAAARVTLLEDRDRIARDLHDHVIQEIFAIGLSLQAVAQNLGAQSPATPVLQERIKDLDGTIRRIRTSIFALRGPLDLAAHGVRQHLTAIAEDLAPALGFHPRLTFSGPLDTEVDGDLADDVIAVVREALTNVAKHARAGWAAIDVVLGADELTLTVADDGVGIGEPSRSSGVSNLRIRAERRGGMFTVTSQHSDAASPLIGSPSSDSPTPDSATPHSARSGSPLSSSPLSKSPIAEERCGTVLRWRVPRAVLPVASSG